MTDLFHADKDTRIEAARIIAETHMLAQVVSKQYDYCQFQYTNDATIVCDGREMCIEEALRYSIIAWFIEIVPNESLLAVAAIAATFTTNVDSPSGAEEINYSFITRLHEMLMYQFNVQNNGKGFISCLCEDPDTMIP